MRARLPRVTTTLGLSLLLLTLGGVVAAAGGRTRALHPLAGSTATRTVPPPHAAGAAHRRAGGAPPAATTAAPAAAATRAARRLQVPWLHGTQDALAVAGVGWLGSSGGTRPVPVASLAKVMTALVVLGDRPLGVGDRGPQVSVTAADVATFRYYDTHDGSVVPVRLHERLTERQALEAMLLPSANNVAVLLARWDAGSVGAFVAKMNITAQALGLTATHYTDPSGFDPRSVSTASDQVRLGVAALSVPVLARIVAERSAEVPVAGEVHNVNRVLGRDGIVGLKTGSSDAAGACYLFAARLWFGGARRVLVGAILGQHTPGLLSIDFTAARRMVAAVRVLGRVSGG